MRKKLAIIMGLLAVIVMIGVGVCFQINRGGSKSDTYVIFNSGLYLNNEKSFFETELLVEAVALGKQLGNTSEGQQVYEIVGMDSNEWVCLRNNGQERVYRSSKKGLITQIEDLEIDKIEVRDHEEIECILTTEDTVLIEELVNSVSDENIVTDNVNAATVKRLTLYSKKYKGLCYVCYYSIDKNGDSYLYDMNMDVIWKMPKAIFEQ